jgi:hypothetical protein
MLCKYRHIFGKEREGIHSIRLFDVAIIDVVLTVLAAFLISLYFKYNVFIVILLLFVLGILLHKIFCVKTKVDNILFGSTK